MKPRTLLQIATTALMLCASAARGQTGGGYNLTWFTIDGGGAMFSNGGGFLLSGTIGQPDAGLMTGGAFALSGGFWLPLTGGQPPMLLAIAGSLGGTNPDTGLSDTFISPLEEACGLSAFSLDATEPLTLNGFRATYTGAGTVPRPVLISDGGGQHTLTLDPPPERGEWLKLELDVTGAVSGANAVFTIWVAHQPLDITQDGRSNIADATAFGTIFGSGQEAGLVDINCDNRVNVQDATAFGVAWTRWANTRLPPKP